MRVQDKFILLVKSLITGLFLVFSLSLHSQVTVTNPIERIVVLQDWGDTYIDLSNVFSDATGNPLSDFELVSNSGESFINARIEVDDLILSYTPGMIGEANIIVRGLTPDGYNYADNEFSVIIYTNDYPVSFYNDPPLECGPQNITLNNYSIFAEDAGVIFQWEITSENFAKNYETVNVVDNFQPGIYQVNLTAYNLYDEYLGEENLSFVVNGKFNNFRMSATTACPDERVEFYIEREYNWIEWNFGDGHLSDYNWAEHHFKELGEHNIRMIVNHQCGMDTVFRKLNIANNAVPRVDFYVEGDIAACPNDVMNFASVYEAETYNWDFGDGYTSTDKAPRHSFAQIGEYNVKLTVTNKCGGTNSITKRISIENDLEAYAGFDFWPDVVCPNNAVYFQAHSSGHFEWDFGDGAESKMRDPQNFYNETGEYKVTLTNRNGCGSVDKQEQYISVQLNEYDIPFAEIGFKFYDGENLTIPPGERVFFENYTWDPNGLDFLWDFGDGKTSSLRQPFHKYDTPGEYQVNFTATNNCGGAGTAILVVTVDPQYKPDVTMNAFPSTVCPGETVYFFDDNEANNIQKLYAYTIDYDDGTVDENITDLTLLPPHVLSKHVYNEPGTYTCTITATNTAGNTTVETKQVVVTNDATVEPQYYITNDTKSDDGNVESWIYYTDYGSLAFIYLFHESNYYYLGYYYPEDDYHEVISEGDFFKLEDNLIELNDYGYYSCGEGIAQYNAFTTEDQLLFEPVADQCFERMTLLSGGTFSFYHQPDQDEDNSMCPGDPVQFAIIGGSSYEWNFTDGTTSTKAFPSKTYNHIGNFEERVSVTNSCGNTKELITLVKINKTNLPDAWFYFEIEKLIAGKEVQFYSEYFDEDEDVNTYLWDFGDGTTSEERDARHKFEEPGYYNVTLTAKNGCGERRETQKIYIKDSYLKSKFTYSASDKTITFKDESFGNPTGWLWNFGDGATSTKQNPQHTYSEEGLFEVCLTIKDNTTGTIVRNCIPVQVGTLPCFADFTYYTNIANNTVFFENLSSEGVTDYFWEFGDGQKSYKDAPEHQYDTPGVYDVKLTIYDENTNCSSTTYDMVAVGLDDAMFEAYFSYFIDPSTNTVVFTDESMGEITEWYWEFGDGTNSLDQSPEHIFPGPGIYDVCLYVMDGLTGNFMEYCEEVYLIDENTSALHANFDFIIDQETNEVKFIDLSKGNPTEIYWDFGDGGNSVESEPVHIFPHPGFFNVCLFVYDENTDSYSEKCIEIEIFPEGEYFCSTKFQHYADIKTKTVKFTDKSDCEFTEWFWDFGDGYFAEVQNPTHTYEYQGIYDVCLFAYDEANDYYSEKCKEIMLVDTNSMALHANFTYMTDPDTREVKFRNTSMGTPTEYFWTFDDGDASELANPKHVFPGSGMYIVCLHVYDENTDQYSERCKEVIIEGVQVNAAFSNFIDPETNTVNFTDMSTGNITEYYWDFGNGDYSVEPNPEYEYSEAGEYDVCLYVYDELSDTYSEECKNIIIHSGSSEAFKAEFTYMVDPETKTVKFKDNSTGDISGTYWTFGDGDYSEDQNPTHTYKFAGNFFVCLFVYNETTGEFDEYCNEIMVGSEDCDIGADFKYFVKPEKLTGIFASRSYGDIGNTFWSFGDGATAFGKDTVMHSYKAPGYYFVGLAVIDKSGECASFTEKLIQVGKVECRAEFEYNVDIKNNSVSFTDKSKGQIVDYYWDFGDGDFSTDKNPVHQYSEPGMYFVSLTVSDESGMCFDVFFTDIQVGQISCSAAFSYYVDAETNTVHFTNEALGEATDVYWIFGDGNVSFERNPVHQFKAPGYYTISLNTFNDINWCMDYHEEVILVGSEGNDFEANFVHQINGKKVKFFNKSSGEPTKYFWHFGDEIISQAKDTVHTYDKPGHYNVCLTIFDDEGRQNTRCKVISVDLDANNDCFADFIFNADVTNKTVSFQNKSKGNPDIYLWHFGDGETSQDENPVHTYAQEGFYNVRLIVRNSTTGCESNNFYLINVSERTGLLASFIYEKGETDEKTGGYPLDYISASFGSPAKVVWDFGDGTQDSTTTTPSHIYQDPGKYNVCLTISDPNTGETKDTCQLITVGSVWINTKISNIETDEDAEPLKIDLTDAFEGETNVSIKLTSNSNPDLITATLNDLKLTLVFNSNQNGEATIAISGMANDESIDNEFTVTVNPVDDAPEIANPIDDIAARAGDADKTIDLSSVFVDIDNEVSEMTFEVSNTNSDIVTASLSGNNLTLAFADKMGDATITIKATSNGMEVSDDFNVHVGSIQVSNPVDNIVVDEDSEAKTIDISNLFTSDVAVTASLKSNSNESLLTASLDGNVITLTFAENKSGTAEITISGSTGSESVDTKFTVTVNPVDDAPFIVSEIADITAKTDSESQTIDLSVYFDDIDNIAADFSYAATVGNESVVSATINDANLTLEFLAEGETTIIVEAKTNALTVEDEFSVKVDKATSINGLTENMVKIFPNPNTGRFTIQLNREFSNADLEIVNLQGQLLYSSTINSSEMSVDLHNFANGMYYIRIKNNGELFISKFVIQK